MLRNALCAMLVATPLAAADEHRWHVELSNPVLSPENPSTIITLSAGFPAADWALADIAWSTPATEPGWDAASMQSLVPHPLQMSGMLSPDGRSITRQRALQLAVFGFWPDQANPLPVWRAVFTATDFSAARDVTVTTETEALAVWADEPQPDAFPRPRPLPVEAFATIRVIPAPAPLALLGACALAAARRRRWLAPRSNWSTPC